MKIIQKRRRERRKRRHAGSAGCREKGSIKDRTVPASDLPLEIGLICCLSRPTEGDAGSTVTTREDRALRRKNAVRLRRRRRDEVLNLDFDRVGLRDVHSGNHDDFALEGDRSVADRPRECSRLI